MKLYSIISLTLTVTASLFSESWKIKSQTEWKKNIQSSKGIVIKDNLVSPKEKNGHFKTKLKKFKSKKSLQSLTITSPLFGKTGKKSLALARPILRMHPSSLQKDPRITGYLAVMTRQDHPKVNNPVNLKQRMPSSRDSMFPLKQLQMKTSSMHLAV